MKALTIFILLVIPIVVRAQVSGKIKDSKGQPVTFASAYLLNPADSSTLQAMQSDGQGGFSFISIKQGTYRLRISALGYQTYNSPIFELKTAQLTKDFGVIVLKENNKELSEVVIRAGRPLTQHRADGTIINVASSILSKGSTALEVLGRSPGVIIDRQNGGISLNGKTGVQIMINGKAVRLPADQVLGLLNGMNANDLSRIELLTNPSAVYDAEGSGGLINIVLRADRKKGAGGDLSLMGGYGYGEKAGLTGRADLNTNSLHLYGSYNFNQNHTYSDFHAIGSELEPLLGGLAVSDYKSTTTGIQRGQNASTGFDLKIDSLTTLGGGIIFNESRFHNQIINTGSYLVGADSAYRLAATINGLNKWSSFNYNAFFNKEWQNGQKINFDLTYIRYSSAYPIDIISSFLNAGGNPVNSNDTLFSPQQKGMSGALIRQFAAQANYTKQFSSRLSLDVGLKETQTHTNSSSAIESLINGRYTSRPAAVNHALFRENITAAYVSTIFKPDSSTTLQTGLRYEYTAQSVAGQSMGAFFPNILLTKILPGQARLFLSYNKRISRPSFSDLASYITYNGPQSVNTGNPFLKPTLTNALRLGYQKTGYTISLSVSRNVNPIARYQTVYTADSLQMAVSPQNVRYQNNVLIQAAAPFRINSIWNMNFDLSGGWRQFRLDYTPVPANKSYFAYNLHSTQSLKLSSVLSFELLGYFNSPFYDGSKKVNGYGLLDAGLKLDLKGNSGSLQLSANDLLRSGTVTSYFGALTREAFDLKTHVDFHPETAKRTIFKLSYSRSFGKTPKSDTDKAKEKSSSESERIR